MFVLVGLFLVGNIIAYETQAYIPIPGILRVINNSLRAPLSALSNWMDFPLDIMRNDGMGFAINIIPKANYSVCGGNKMCLSSIADLKK